MTTLPNETSPDPEPRRVWDEVDSYALGLLAGPDPVLDAALERSERAGLPSIAVSAAQGRLLEVMARILGARRILEIGTLGGFSTICLARGLASGGRLTTLEVNPEHAAVARRNIAAAGFADSVDIEVGPALDSLRKLVAVESDPFDLIFIDADKPNIPGYFEHALALARPGSTIIVDNVVRKGALIDESGEDASVKGVRGLHQLVGNERRVVATTIQTVGSKGYDGFLIAVVRD